MSKRARIELPGRRNIVFATPELQSRLGKRYYDEAELLPVLLANGLVRRVRTIQLEVRPLGGDSFNVTIAAENPSVAEAKVAIANVQGTLTSQQDLYRVAVRADGRPVREDDAEAELLNDDHVLLEDGQVIVMAVKDGPFVWRTFHNECVELREDGAVASHNGSGTNTLTTTGVSITQGRHYWEVELLSANIGGIFVGVSRPNLEPRGHYWGKQCTSGWFIDAHNGGLFGDGKYNDDRAGGYTQNDRVGVLLDLNAGSLLFFKNGLQHGPGYPAGSITAPEVPAVSLYSKEEAVRLLPSPDWPVGHAQSAIRQR
jgi:hypothetical protein